jgi:putative ABC transport system substrate-binding protein
MLLGGAAAAWPLAGRAQQQTMPVIGYLSARSPDDTTHLVAAFRRGLLENGYVEDQNVSIEYRWALGQYERLPELAAELVRRRVTVIASTGGEPAVLAARAATSTLPIVFAMGGDPVKAGLAASYNRPGGNASGISILTESLEPKRLGLVHELVPQATAIGVLLNPKFPPAEEQLRHVQQASAALGIRIHVLGADTDEEIDAAFETVAQQRMPALAVFASPFFDTRRNKIVTLAVRRAVPTIYHFREYAMAGGLMSYGIDIADAYRQVGVYAGQVLKGAKPADLPVLQPTKFELVINLKTAKALGLEVPSTLLARADEVIE